jgi:hypothetical protein
MYNPVFPSSLLDESFEGDSEFSYYSKVFGNNSLRVGVVLEVIESDDENNLYGLGPEYIVMTGEQNESGSISNVQYSNCLRLDTLGGVADFFFSKLRPVEDQEKVRETGKFNDQKGSVVLMLCLDSNSEKGIIIGSLAHPLSKKLDKELGHHMEGEFNGVNWQVDKDGALTVTFKSATDSEGKAQDEEAGGTQWKIEKDGSFEFSDGNTEIIRADKTNKTISIDAESDISQTTKANVNITADESMNITLKKDLIAEAEGKVSLTSKQTFDIKSDGKYSLEAQQIDAKSKSMIQFKAQSMFKAESSDIALIKAPTVGLGPSPAQPALLAFQLVTLGTGNVGAPVVSNAIAGFSTSVLLSV